MKSAVVFVLILTLTLPALAQAAPPAGLPAAPRSPLREAARRASAAVSLSPLSPQETAGPAEPQRSWAGRHPVLLGMLTGIAVGSAYGIATCRYPTAEGGSCDDYTFPGNARLLGMATYGGLGAGIGAAIGGLVVLARH